MSSSLEVRISQVEALFEENSVYTNSNTIVKSHITSTLEEAGYKKLEDHEDTYHKIGDGKIEVFGFKYKKQDELYHATFDDLHKANEFLKLSKIVNNYHPSILVAASTGVGGLMGIVMGVLIGSTIPSSSFYPTNLDLPITIGIIAGSALGFGVSIVSQGSDQANSKKRLDNIQKEITYGIESLRSATSKQLLLDQQEL